MLPVAIALGILVAACIVILIVRKSKKEPQGWFAGPIIDGTNESEGTIVDITGSFVFPKFAPGVHYVTKACASLAEAKGIRFRYRIDADPDVSFIGCKDGIPVPNGPFLYFQRAGDDWSGEGEYEAYRWWASFLKVPLTPGEHVQEVSFGMNWTAVESSSAVNDPQAFAAALANAARIGFTFPNNEGLGHGCYATGSARFTLLEFSIL